VLSVLFGLTAFLVRNQPIKHGIHLTPDQAGLDLPVDATDVAVLRYGRGTIAFEFTIDEAGFRTWVDCGIGSLESQAAAILIEPITSPTRVRRVLPPDAGISQENWEMVHRGLQYHWRKEDRAVIATYDSDEQRAFYDAHYH
jgi:hypothetical protein